MKNVKKIFFMNLLVLLVSIAMPLHSMHPSHPYAPSARSRHDDGGGYIQNKITTIKNYIKKSIPFIMIALFIRMLIIEANQSPDQSDRHDGDNQRSPARNRQAAVPARVNQHSSQASNSRRPAAQQQRPHSQSRRRPFAPQQQEQLAARRREQEQRWQQDRRNRPLNNQDDEMPAHFRAAESSRNRYTQDSWDQEENQPQNHRPRFGNLQSLAPLYNPTPLTSADIKKLNVFQFNVTRQQHGDCGLHAIANAKNIDDLLNQGRAIADLNNGQAYALGAGALRAQGISYHNGLSDVNIMLLAKSTFNMNNCSLIAYVHNDYTCRTTEHDISFLNSGRATSAYHNDQIRHMIRQLKTNPTGAIHFVCGIDSDTDRGHWLLISIIKQRGNAPYIAYMDSNNTPLLNTPGAAHYIRFIHEHFLKELESPRPSRR